MRKRLRKRKKRKMIEGGKKFKGGEKDNEGGRKVQ